MATNEKMLIGAFQGKVDLLLIRSPFNLANMLSYVILHVLPLHHVHGFVNVLMTSLDSRNAQ